MIAPSRKGIALLCINAIFCTLATTAYVLRFRNNLSRARKGLLPWGHFITTDSLVFGAMVLVNLNGAFRIVSIVLGGVGWNVDQLNIEQIEWALKASNLMDALFVEELAWTTSLCLLKFALIILYGRVFVANTGMKHARLIQVIAFAAVSGLLIGSITYYLTECKPLAAAWTPNLGNCRNQRQGWLGTGIANLITDVVIFSVPVVWLADLKMSLHNKITVGIQLFVGAIVSIISFIRIFFVLKSDPNNVTGSVVKPDIFSCIELTMAIVFASVAGIAGREAISNFVDRFIVPRSPNHGGGGHRPSGVKRLSSAGSRDIRMVDSRNWVKIDASMGEALVINVDEVKK